MERDIKNITKSIGSDQRSCDAITPISDGARRNVVPNTSNIRSTSYSRRTMLPEFPQKSKTVTSRQSADIQKKADIEAKEIELGLLYDEYLQTIMMDLIVKKKTEEKKNLMVTQLATLTQEIDQDMKKLIQVKQREHDIIHLSLAQKEVDAQLTAIKEYKDKTFNNMKDMLFKLHSLLKPLDMLRCNGIILPATQKEWTETREMLEKCSNTLKNITDLIEFKGETYCSVNNGLKDFTEKYNELENIQKRLQEALCDVQVLLLKNTSLAIHSEAQ